MVNKDIFYSNTKYKALTQSIKNSINKLDNELENIEYDYEAVWRDDRESGGNIFVFEIPSNNRSRSNVKNLITLRPQMDFLKVEVYWGEKNKHYYEVWENGASEFSMLEDIKVKYDKIVNYGYRKK